MSPKARVQKRLYYKIGEACKALEIQPYVLRYWETEFPALSPSKSRSGQRVYSEKELGVIRRIKELLYEEGYTIAGAKKKLETELASGLLPMEPEEGEGEGQEAGAAEGEAGAPPKSAKAAAPASGGGEPPPAAAAPEQGALQLDTRAAERVESMRQGIQRALDEARDIIAFLDSKSPSRR
jgi:DNA-binding transcriptional MerR regulator